MYGHRQPIMASQAAVGSVLHGGGYDSDVEGGGGPYADDAGFQSFSDKAVSMVMRVANNIEIWSSWI